MLSQVTITAIYSGVFLCLFAIGEILYHKLKMGSEITRKIVHVFTGLTCFSFPIWITTHWSVLFLTCSFALILIVSIRYNFLQSINAVDRVTVGSYMFPISIYLIYMSYSIFGHDNLTGSDIQWTAQYTIDGILSDTAAIYYFLPLLIFTISDPLAAMCGQLWPIGKYTLFNETKTLVGSMAFMISSFGITSLFLTFQLTSSTDVLLIAGLMAVVTTAVEGISQKGYDNLFVPLSAAVILALTST